MMVIKVAPWACVLGALAVGELVLGCASSAGSAVPAGISPGARRVQIVTGNPNPDAFEFVGEVSGIGKAFDLAEAMEEARGELRSHAAELGATVVTIDTNTAGNARDWSGRSQVVLNGRAFRPKKAAS